MEEKTDGHAGGCKGVSREEASDSRQPEAWGTRMRWVWLPVWAPVFWPSLSLPLAARLWDVALGGILKLPQRQGSGNHSGACGGLKGAFCPLRRTVPSIHVIPMFSEVFSF